ncbi:ABC-type multidrug transport system fused ATPase/permease subunit [Methanohalophilus levihalophilus]|uniref:hypothetical protein n=1 Tax=Methanohalophilus levihalophilus TaxID=1431282 RepID=UPI001AE7E96E|nr:hypothetical protein [Methanohalophilus levihalophilus]MBP2030395.1 ABC-type multidrug transport system fused ATPase/permease subunit [Methanohalophilus levihalophilus]
MLFEFLPQISFLVFVLAIVGYIAKYFYNIGYYRYAYNPQSQHSLERIFNNSSVGLLLIFLGILFFALSVSNDTSIIPEQIQTIQISEENGEKYMIYSYVFGLVVVFIGYISAFSMLIGAAMSYGISKAVAIDTIDEESPIIHVREIYSENEDFIFYLTLDGRWGSIKKSQILKMTEVKWNSKLDDWLKSDKKHRYYLMAALLLYLLFVFAYRYFL